MSTRTGQDQTALVVVDVQHGVVSQAWQRDAVVKRIADLVDAARAAGAPVVWVQHQETQMPIGSDDWQLVDALVPSAGETRIDKRWGDSFAETGLESALNGLGVTRLVLCGAQTDFCILATLYGAIHRGYDVTLVEDAHTTDDTEFRGRPLTAEVLVTTLVHTTAMITLPGITVTTQSAAAVTW